MVTTTNRTLALVALVWLAAVFVVALATRQWWLAGLMSVAIGYGVWKVSGR